MEDNETKIDAETGEVHETRESEGKAAENADAARKGYEQIAEAHASKYTIDYALEQIEKLREDAAHFAEVTAEKFCALQSFEDGDTAEAAASALATFVERQEVLHIKLADFYFGMISDLRNQIGRDIREQKFLDFVVDCIGAGEPWQDMPDFGQIWRDMNS